LKWERIKVPKFESLKEWNVSVSVDNMIYIFGGSYKKEEEDELWAFNTSKIKAILLFLI